MFEDQYSFAAYILINTHILLVYNINFHYFLYIIQCEPSYQIDVNLWWGLENQF